MWLNKHTDGVVSKYEDFIRAQVCCMLHSRPSQNLFGATALSTDPCTAAAGDCVLPLAKDMHTLVTMRYLPRKQALSRPSFPNEQLRPSGVVPAPRLLHRLARTAVQYKSSSQDPLESLVEQSLQIPVVQLRATTLAAAAAAAAAAPRPQSVQPAHQHQTASSDTNAAIQAPQRNTAQNRGQPVLLRGQQEQQSSQQRQALHNGRSGSSTSSLPQRKLRPSRMDFGLMLGQLTQWKAQHLSAHVPRFCFDAPELGAWVRHVRKQHKDGVLEQWKVERLDGLQFEWELPDQEARWHHLYHQLRRHRLLHGSSEVDAGKSGSGQGDWPAVARWLSKQGRLLAKQKLNGQKVAMLQLLEVTLRLPKRLVHRTAQLQALNGPERRKLRKKWKQLDATAAEQEQQRRRQEWQQQREVERQQQLVADRRQALLSNLQGLGQPEQTQTLLQQQRQQPWQQLLPSMQHEQVEPQVPDVQVARQASVEPLGSRQACVQDIQQVQDIPGAVLRLQQQSPQQQQSSQQQQPQLSSSLPPQGQQKMVGCAKVQKLEQLPVMQKQEQQNDTLFYQRNCRGRGARQKSRQEKWLATQQQVQEHAQGHGPQ
ncbi:hypothetical protein COO60DRAFT_217099 [Scenedesmus sp. NREL 46B-D3]|nr:hypothetical protein COO60DRAFT_217099 [Scenedesmus sp. NREL 46B-D3]